MAEKVFVAPNPYKASSNSPVTEHKNYDQTWLEFASQTYEQVWSQQSRFSSGTTSIYAVPFNRIFFLTNVSLSTSISAAAVGQTDGRIEINDVPFLRQIVTSGVAATNDLSKSNDLNFVMPLKFGPNTRFNLVCSQTAGFGDTNATIIGFLVPLDHPII